MSLPPPFPAKPEGDSLIHDPKLQAALRPIWEAPLYANSGFMIADLSGGTSQFAGWNMDTPRFCGSVVKIAAMFAAFQLRENLKAAANGLKKDEIFPEVTKAWKARVEGSVGGKPNFPQLDQIFTPSDGNVEFAMNFEADLELMISKSDDPASGRCIRKLGHQYINGALASEGLYSAKRSGLWLGGDYAQIEYRSVPGGTTHYAATPAALLRFLDLLNAGHLVSGPASDDMKKLMNNFYTPRFLQHMGVTFSPPPASFGKLGWEYVGAGKSYFDAGVIERLHPRGTFRYAIVMLGSHFDGLDGLAIVLDHLILNWHHH